MATRPDGAIEDGRLPGLRHAHERLAKRIKKIETSNKYFDGMWLARDFLYLEIARLEALTPKPKGKGRRQT